MSAVLFSRPVAHRGLHNRSRGIIENSAAAFDAAIGRGFAIECDVQLTADDVPVIIHDHYLERLMGLPGRVRDMTSEELTRTPLLDSATGDCPQRFTDFLKLVDGRVLLQIELKHQDGAEATHYLARRVADALKSYSGPVTIESFDPDLIQLVRDYGFTGPRGIITYDYAERDDEASKMSPEQRFMLRNLLHWERTRFDFISCAKDALDLPAMVFWRSLGLPITTWTIRSAAEAEAVRSSSDQIVFEGFDPEPAP